MNTPSRPAARFATYFGERSVLYAETRPVYPTALFHFLAMTCRRTKQAWDCATGNGQSAVGLAARFAAVLATDPSPDMIDKAVKHPRVRYAITDYATRLADKSVDLVTVGQALHWLDVDALFREAYRVLVPQGVFAAWCYSNCRVSPAIDEIFDQFYSVTIGPFWPAERRHVDNGYQSIALPIDEIPPPPMQMMEEWRLRQYLAYIRSWSGVARFIEARGEEAIVAFEAEITRAWGAETFGRSVRWPLHFRIGQIR